MHGRQVFEVVGAGGGEVDFDRPPVGIAAPEFDKPLLFASRQQRHRAVMFHQQALGELAILSLVVTSLLFLLTFG